MITIKRRLKQLRQERGLSMAQFSKAIGVSPGNVGDWESEKRSSTPGAAALIQIATTFNISLDWLLLGQQPDELFPFIPGMQDRSGPFLHRLVGKSSYPDEQNQQNQVLPILMETVSGLSDQDLHLLVLFARRLQAPVQ